MENAQGFSGLLIGHQVEAQQLVVSQLRNPKILGCNVGSSRTFQEYPWAGMRGAQNLHL